MDRPGEPTASTTDDPAVTVARVPASLVGLAAAAAALGMSELVAGVFDSAPSLLIGIGDTVIRVVPGWLERDAIARFGTNDKTVLIIGTLAIAAIAGALLGRVARRRFVVAASGFAAFGVLGVVATATRPDTSAIGALVVGALATATGVATLWYLNALAEQVDETPTSTRTTRRKFLISAGGTLVVGALAGLGGWILSGRERVNEIRRAIRIPRPDRRARPTPIRADLGIAGLTPLYIPNDSFYRIDTALRPPTVEPDNWRLELRGRVDHPYSLTYRELMALPQIEADITLACVSNEVGGNLVGNARWQGVRLRDLLERAGVQKAGAQLIGHSVDGFTAGFPTSMALDSDDAMVAVAMNGEPLPIDHGFPARLVVPGLYGYVSATKWLNAIELTGWDTEGYWIPRGWAAKGPIKTQSRIDVPTPGDTVRAGRVVIAGVAWAPTRGIDKVEIKVGDGPWQTATLADSLGVNCWRQWHLIWEAPPGSHTITARATDGTGTVQTAKRTPVAPDGASGYPSIQVTVTS